MQFHNFTKSKINPALFKKAENIALKLIGFKKEEVEISLAIVGGKKMRELNKYWRKKNQPTDVLSFGFWKSDFHFYKKKYFGEIVVCLPVARENIKKFKYELKKELIVLFIHGILHLGGYNHERSKKEALKMKRMEEKIFKKFEIRNLKHNIILSF